MKRGGEEASSVWIQIAALSAGVFSWHLLKLKKVIVGEVKKKKSRSNQSL